MVLQVREMVLGVFGLQGYVPGERCSWEKTSMVTGRIRETITHRVLLIRWLRVLQAQIMIHSKGIIKPVTKLIVPRLTPLPPPPRRHTGPSNVAPSTPHPSAPAPSAHAADTPALAEAVAQMVRSLGTPALPAHKLAGFASPAHLAHHMWAEYGVQARQQQGRNHLA